MTIPTPTSPILLSDGLSATTTTGYGLVTGAVATVDTGATQPWIGYAVLNVNAINASAGPYILNILGNTNSTWTGTTQNLGTAQVSATGQTVIQFNTIYNLVSYRYIRLQIVTGGTSPTITVQSFILPLTSFATMTTDQLTQLLVQSLANFNNAVTNLEAWAGGTATGGPSSNGYYPLSDGQGNTVNQPSPAKIASLATTGAQAPFLFTSFASTSINAAVTQVRTSGYRTLGKGAATYIASSTGTKSAWVAQSADGRYWSLSENVAVTPLMFGAVGDGNSHAASVYYATLAALQADYPFASSLSQEIDWIAWQAALNYGGKVDGLNLSYKLYNSTAASQTYPLSFVSGQSWVEGSNYHLDCTAMTTQTTSTHMVSNYNFASSSNWANASQYGSAIINATFGSGKAQITDTSGGTHFSQFGQQVTLTPGFYRAICTVGISLGASYASGNTQPPYGSIAFFSSGIGQVQTLGGRSASTYDVTSNVIGSPGTYFTQNLEADFYVSTTTTIWYTWTSGGYGNFQITNMDIVPWIANAAVLLTRDGTVEHYPVPEPFGGCEINGPGTTLTSIRGIVYKSFNNTDGTLIRAKDVLVTGFGTGVSYEDGAYLIEHNNFSCIGNHIGVVYNSGATNAGENIHWHGGAVFNNDIGISNPGSGEFHFHSTPFDYNTQAVVQNYGRIEFHGCRHEMTVPSDSTKPLYDVHGSGRIAFHGGFILGAGSVGTSPVAPINVADALSRVDFYGTEIYNLSSSSGVMAAGNGIVRAYGWKNAGNPNVGTKMISRNLSMDVFGGSGGFETFTGNGLWLPQAPGAINIPGGVYSLAGGDTVTNRWTTTNIQAAISTDYAHTGTHSLKITRLYGSGVGNSLVLAVPVQQAQDVWGEFFWLTPANVGTGTGPVYVRGFWMVQTGLDAYGRPQWGDRSQFIFENDITVPLAGSPTWQQYNFSTTYNSQQAPAWATHCIVLMDFGSLAVLPFYLDDWTANVF